MLSMTVTPQSSALFLPALSKPTTALMENCENEKDDELLKIPDPDLRAAPFMNSSSKAPLFCRESSHLVEGSPVHLATQRKDGNPSPSAQLSLKCNELPHSYHQGHDRGGERLLFLC